ncbi:DUF2064 domain-containing protein [Dermatophilaceae bacterium Soc4.6]
MTAPVTAVVVAGGGVDRPGPAAARRAGDAVVGADLAREVPHTVVVIAKSPVPGRVKTRLTPTFSGAEAAALAAASLRDTLDVVGGVGAVRVVVAWDGPPVPWLPDDAERIGQRGGGLDERLEAVFHDLLADLAPGLERPTLLVGMDTPQLTADLLTRCWQGADAVLGLSQDGGYWAIGFRRHVPGAILGVPMSTETTGEEQLRRLRSLGLRVAMLPALLDVDGPGDAVAVAALAPDTRFGRLHRRLVGTPCDPGHLFDAALHGVPVRVVLPSGPAGRGPVLDVTSWHTMSEVDELVVARCEAPVLDVGCRPGRFVAALGERGLAALGVDISRAAVASTARRGATALQRDVHHPLPGEGRWGTVLLADGNIGIGGDPLALLRRCHELLRPGALAVVEVASDDGADTLSTICLEEPHGRRSTPIPWAVVGSRRLVELASGVGFVAVEEWRADHRAFVTLRSLG